MLAYYVKIWYWSLSLFFLNVFVFLLLFLWLLLWKENYFNSLSFSYFELWRLIFKICLILLYFSLWKYSTIFFNLCFVNWQKKDVFLFNQLVFCFQVCAGGSVWTPNLSSVWPNKLSHAERSYLSTYGLRELHQVFFDKKHLRYSVISTYDWIF